MLTRNRLRPNFYLAKTLKPKAGNTNKRVKNGLLKFNLNEESKTEIIKIERMNRKLIEMEGLATVLVSFLPSI